MALQLKQSLTLAQQLIMTPQLQQAIKLLQLSRLELLETVHTELESNPVLEEHPSEGGDEEKESTKDADSEPNLAEVDAQEKIREDMDWETYLSEYNKGWAESPYEAKEAPSFENVTASKPSLQSHLMWQLNMTRTSETAKEIAIHIIGNLDDDGYLTLPVEELSQITQRPPEEVIETLSIVQKFDPVGVAARDTRECLLIQARFQNLGGTLIEKIILDHMDRLENKKYEPIAKSLSVPLEDVLDAVSIITTFEPKPGRQYSDEETIYISPDIYVFKMGDAYEIVLNEDGLPKLKINAYYRDILTSKEALEDGTKQYIQEKLKSAAWLIKSIHQRQRTIYRVTSSIVQFQKEFLDKGIAHLKPLVLRDVAEDIQMHESTISRVTHNKYMHTPQGIYELKFFFNAGITSTQGENLASESVKNLVREIIAKENPKNPYSDEKLVQILKGMNIHIARRTVSKYRELMKILSSNERRKIS